ncbi:hypothetical protein BD626DRAFT_503033, partial [Schizophyllum amplum]
MWVLLTATHYRLLWTRLSTHRCGVVFVALIMPEPAFKYSRRGVPHAFRTCPGRKFERAASECLRIFLTARYLSSESLLRKIARR